MTRLSLAGFACVAVLLLPSVVSARDGDQSNDQHPSMLSYGLDGLVTGAGVGLAAGYLSTGTRYQTGEWRKLVIGTGVGAIAGLGIGIALAVVDDSMTGPGIGSYVLRDLGYGVILGALSGAVIGALFYVDSDHAKDIPVGAAVGTLIGAGVGAVIGVLEGSNARRRYARSEQAGANLRFSVHTATNAGGSPVIMPALRGSF
jgi:peptidoglycan/LPS O-acetylase OafA/YrhL